MGDREIVIDLDTTWYDDRPAEADGSPPPTAVRRRWWRTTAMALTAVLVFGTGGANPAPAPPLREVYVAPLVPISAYRLGDGVLFTTEPIVETDRRGHRITGYDLADGRRLWSSDFATDRPGIGVSLRNRLLLVQQELGEYAGVRTTAVDPRTGRRRWSVPYWLNPLPGAPIGLVFDNIFAPESRLTPGQPGTSRETYLSAAGYAYSEPPIGLVVRAIDLDTGRFRWESPRLDDAVLVPGAGDHPATLLTASPGGTVEVRDLATGTVRHRLDWPGGELSSADRVGDVVVVVSRSGPAPGATAFSADLRRRRWSRALTGPNPFVEACGPVLCQPDPDGTVAYDPATGETLWRLPEQARLLSTGSRLIELDTDHRLRRILDPLTGRTVGDLDGWQLVDTNTWPGVGRFPPDPPPLVLKPNPVAQQTAPGLLDLAGPAVRPLGVLPHVLLGCEAAHRFIACRTTDGQLRVWRYELSHARRE